MEKVKTGEHALIGLEEALGQDIHRISVLVIGAGGTGSLLVSRLARIDQALKLSGRKGLKVMVVDPDVVEPMNVGRQLFTNADLGEYKADVVVSRVNQAYGLDWDTGYFRVTEKNLATSDNRWNFVFTCTDNVQSRKAVWREWFDIPSGNRHVDNYPYYWIDCGNSRNGGQVILSDVHQTLKNTFDFGIDLDEMEKEQVNETCTFREKLQDQSLFVNDEIALCASEMFFQLIYYRYLTYSAVFTSLDSGQRSRGIFAKEPLQV